MVRFDVKKKMHQIRPVRLQSFTSTAPTIQDFCQYRQARDAIGFSTSGIWPKPIEYEQRVQTIFIVTLRQLPVTAKCFFSCVTQLFGGRGHRLGFIFATKHDARKFIQCSILNVQRITT
jgi:hypothetical protein